MSAPHLVTFDLDGVLCRPPFGINPGRGMNKRRDTPGSRNLLWLTESWRYRGRRPMPGARTGFEAVRRFAECHVLSARGEAARSQARAWFQRYFGFVPVIHLRPSWEETSAQFKVRKVTELGASAHFEDDPHTAEWLAELGPEVFLVDWWRNRWLEDVPHLHRINAISEAVPQLAATLALPR